MRKVRARWSIPMSFLVLSLAIGPTEATAAGPAWAGEQDTSIGLTRDEASAIRFRETFGFESSLEFVRAAAANPTRYSDDEYGVPLDDVELSELQRRSEIRAAIDPLVKAAAKHETFAGLYFDQHAGGVPVFMFTADLPDREADLAKIVPPEFDFQTRLATRTYQQLTEVNERFASTWNDLKAEGIDIVRAGIRTSENVIEVGVHGLTPAISTRLKEVYGPGLVIAEQDSAVGDACVNILNCRPMKGGITIKAADGGICTSGFVVKATNTGGYRLLTAGHCIEAHGGAEVVWSHDNDSFGKAKDETWKDGATRKGDVGLIDLYGAEVPTNKNRLHTTSSTVINVSGYYLSLYQGEPSCRVGATWHLDCGTVYMPNVTRDSFVAGFGTMHVTQSVEVDFDSTNGDSGGSMYAPTSGYAVAQGTHVHSDPDGPGAHGWYTPITSGQQEFTDRFGYTYTLCINATCT